MNNEYVCSRCERIEDFQMNSRRASMLSQKSNDKCPFMNNLSIVPYDRFSQNSMDKSDFLKPRNSIGSISKSELSARQRGNSFDLSTDSSSLTSDGYPKNNKEQYVLNVKKLVINQNDNRMENFHNILKPEHSFRRKFPLVTPRRNGRFKDEENLGRRPEPKISKVTFPIQNRSQSLSRSKEDDFDRFAISFKQEAFSRGPQNRRYSLINQDYSFDETSNHTPYQDDCCMRHMPDESDLNDQIETWPVTIKSIAQPIITPRKTTLNLNVVRNTRGYDRMDRMSSEQMGTPVFQHTITAHKRNDQGIKVRPKTIGHDNSKRRCRSVHFASDVSVAEVMDEYPFIITQTILKDFP